MVFWLKFDLQVRLLPEVVGSLNSSITPPILPVVLANATMTSRRAAAFRSRTSRVNSYFLSNQFPFLLQTNIGSPRFPISPFLELEVTSFWWNFFSPKTTISSQSVSPLRRATLLNCCIKIICLQMPTVAINVVLHEPRIMAGDELFAKVLLESADSDTIVDEFYADIEGVGRTGWVNVHTDKIYEAEREYLQKHIPLMPSGSSLPAGRHQFPLRVFIPETAPSSYESQFGNTRYTIKVVLKTNSEQSTCTEVFPFVVVARLFFDDIPQNIMQNIEFKDEVDFTCCSLPFGTVSIKISLPRTGYRIGEMLSCTVIIYNRTRKALKDCCVHVVLKTQFEAMSRYEHVNEKKLSERVVETAVLGNVKSRTDVQFDNCLLKIPESTPPTQCYNKHSPDPNIIALTYVLRFVALPGRFILIVYEYSFVIANFIQHFYKISLTRVLSVFLSILSFDFESIQ
ncbi:unnamed protein product [Toxocara canis]|uniref:Arrestin_C domain-containing protein n=1 Tax=Toxocara canis TaxID=6265 RepID=A0A183UN12_TOXCA|nr:unnamed protein product [Toxocara canis]